MPHEPPPMSIREAIAINDAKLAQANSDEKFYTKIAGDDILPNLRPTTQTYVLAKQTESANAGSYHKDIQEFLATL